MLICSQSDEPRIEKDLEDRIKALTNELESLTPNMRANERFESVKERLKATDTEYETARRHAKDAKDQFSEVKAKRFELFNKAFSHISEQIGPIYRDLTREDRLPMGGQAWVLVDFTKQR